MTRSDLIIATIRTATPGAIGYLIAQLIAAIPDVQDWFVTIDEVLAVSVPGVTVVALVNAAAVGLAVAAYYWAARELGRRFPVLERFLLGSAKTPSYAATVPAAAPQAVVNITSLPNHVEQVDAESDGFALALEYGHKLGKTSDDVLADYQAIAVTDVDPKHRA